MLIAYTFKWKNKLDIGLLIHIEHLKVSVFQKFQKNFAIARHCINISKFLIQINILQSLKYATYTETHKKIYFWNMPRLQKPIKRVDAKRTQSYFNDPSSIGPIVNPIMSISVCNWKRQALSF